MRTAFVLGKITPAKEKESIYRLSQLDNVSDARLVVGKFDFVAKIHFEDFEGFFDSYLKIKRISSIETRKILIANGTKIA